MKRKDLSASGGGVGGALEERTALGHGEAWVRNELLGTACLRPALPAQHPCLTPQWLDEGRMKRARSIFHKHFLSIFVANLVGLLSILAIPSILRVLASTKRSSTPATANERYLATLTHLMRWYKEDVFDSRTSAFKSIRTVQTMHANAFSNTPASQSDLALTQWAFFGLILTRGAALGLALTSHEEEDFVHFWRVVGYLMGIEDRFNLCAGDLIEIRSRCEAIAKQVIVKGLLAPPEDFPAMSDALLKGVHRIAPPLDPHALRAFACHILRYKFEGELNWYSGFMFCVMQHNFSIILHTPCIGELTRRVENNLLRLNINICNHYPSIVRGFALFETSVLWAWFHLRVVGRVVRRVVVGVLNLGLEVRKKIWFHFCHIFLER